MTKWTISAFLAAILSVVGVYEGAAVMGFNLDRPAWHSELVQWAGYSLKREAQIKRRQSNEVESHVKDLKHKKLKVPDWVKEQRRQLRRDLKVIEKLLKEK